MERILVIDDDNMFRGMVKLLFGEEGYDVVEAGNGKIGVQQFQQLHPDLVICDLIMPEKEGLETIQELQRINHKIPIVAVSGGGEAGPGTYLELAKAMGAKKTFSKPFIPRAFVEEVIDCMKA